MKYRNDINNLLEEARKYFDYRDRYNLSSNNIDRVHYFLRDQNSIIRAEFKLKLNDLISCLELISQLKYHRFNSIPVTSIQIDTIIDKLRNRSSEEIFNMATDTIIVMDAVISECNSEIEILDRIVFIEEIKNKLNKQ